MAMGIDPSFDSNGYVTPVGLARFMAAMPAPRVLRIGRWRLSLWRAA